MEYFWEWTSSIPIFGSNDRSIVWGCFRYVLSLHDHFWTVLISNFFHKSQKHSSMFFIFNILYNCKKTLDIRTLKCLRYDAKKNYFSSYTILQAVGRILSLFQRIESLIYNLFQRHIFHGNSDSQRSFRFMFIAIFGTGANSRFAAKSMRQTRFTWRGNSSGSHNTVHTIISWNYWKGKNSWIFPQCTMSLPTSHREQARYTNPGDYSGIDDCLSDGIFQYFRSTDSSKDTVIPEIWKLTIVIWKFRIFSWDFDRVEVLNLTRKRVLFFVEMLKMDSSLVAQIRTFWWIASQNGKMWTFE